jgi:hypothetical protein
MGSRIGAVPDSTSKNNAKIHVKEEKIHDKGSTEGPIFPRLKYDLNPAEGFFEFNRI